MHKTSGVIHLNIARLERQLKLCNQKLAMSVNYPAHEIRLREWRCQLIHQLGVLKGHDQLKPLAVEKFANVLVCVSSRYEIELGNETGCPNSVSTPVTTDFRKIPK